MRMISRDLRMCMVDRESSKKLFHCKKIADLNIVPSLTEYQKPKAYEGDL